MLLTSKDKAGLLLVAGTLGTLLVHGSDRHQESHLPTVVDAGGAVTSADTHRFVAFVDVNVVPGGEQPVVPRQVVVVEDGTIRRIGPVGVVDPPRDAEIIEGSGSTYLTPGLVDAHVHLPDAGTDLMPLFLANGVTTVFNLEGDERHLALRDRSRSPAFAGPTIYSAGPFVDEMGLDTPEAARAAVRAHADTGFDFIKIHGHLPAAVYEALLEAADSAGVAVVGHAPRNLPFATVLEHGQAGVVHAEELLYTGVPTLDIDRAHDIGRAMADADLWLTPALTTFARIAEQWGSPDALEARLASPEARWLPAELRHSWRTSDPYAGRPQRERERIEAMNRFHAPLVRALHAEGVPMLTGTDAPIPGVVPGFSLHDEIDAMVAAGLPPARVFGSATADAGRFVREHVDPGAHFGQVAEGARADLLLVEADPREDVTILRSPVGVMVRGVWYARSDLRRLMERAARPLAADDAR